MTFRQLSLPRPGCVSMPAETVIPAGMLSILAKSSICLSSLAQPPSLIAAQQLCHPASPGWQQGPLQTGTG